MSAEWEKVTDDTDRLEVPGGWLYRCSVTIHSVEVTMVFVPKPVEVAPNHGNPLSGLPLNGPTLSHAPGTEPEAPEPLGHRQCAGCLHQMKPAGWPTWGCSQFSDLQSAEHQEWWDEFACSDEDEWPKCPVRADAPF